MKRVVGTYMVHANVRKTNGVCVCVCKPPQRARWQARFLPSVNKKNVQNEEEEEEERVQTVSHSICGTAAVVVGMAVCVFNPLLLSIIC